jgi:hypothetical protein
MGGSTVVDCGGRWYAIMLLTVLNWKNAKRLVIAVIGGTVLLIGIIGIVIPPLPAIIFVPLGLAILGTEFLWARRLLTKVRARTPGFRRSRPKATLCVPSSNPRPQDECA